MYQKLILIGNLGKEPELRFTPDGKPVCTFSLATSTRKDEATWFRVSVWDKQAEACNQYLHKGSKALVEGRLRGGDDGNPRTFQRKDGTYGASFEVTADVVKFLDSKGAKDDADDQYSAEVPF